MPLDNIRVVLVRPQGPANVGAAARALKNMGLQHLVVVRPHASTPARPEASTHPFWAQAMAVHAGDVLAGVRQVASLGEAVADCGLVVGTTCRDGLYRAAAEPPRSVAPRLLAAAQQNRAALVFGPEDRGLSNEDLKACHQLIRIPTAAEYPSLNLAQAVMICCYEILLAQQAIQSDAVAADPAPAALAPAAEVDRMLGHLRTALLSIGFLHRDNPDHIMFAFRRFLGRAQLEEREVRILLGLARQIEWFGRGGWRTMAMRHGSAPSPGEAGPEAPV
jgi:tRNA/rRNA methyltransferase